MNGLAMMAALAVAVSAVLTGGAQVRLAAPFAYNNITGLRNSVLDIGIGNNPVPNGNPDWTFASTAGNYRIRRLTVLVK